MFRIKHKIIRKPGIQSEIKQKNTHIHMKNEMVRYEKSSAHEKNVENLIKMHTDTHAHAHRHAQYNGMFMKYGP